ncbi:MAG: ABC transporter permease [Firmicutes bacterium]|nr:ABC transporter permease [Bacillota bacterium]
MTDILLIELIKLKELKYLWLLPVCILAPVMIGYIKWYEVHQQYGYVIGWNYVFPIVEIEATNGLLMIVVALFSSLLFINEYSTGCIYNMFIYPHSRVKFFLGKMIVSFLICFVSAFLLFVFTVAVGVILLRTLPFPWLIWHHIKIHLYITILLFLLIPLTAMISIIGKSFIVTLLFTLSIYVLNLIFGSVISLQLLPWNVLTNVVQSLQIGMAPQFGLNKIDNFTPYVLSCIFTFFLPLIGSIVYYIKADV